MIRYGMNTWEPIPIMLAAVSSQYRRGYCRNVVGRRP